MGGIPPAGLGRQVCQEVERVKGKAWAGSMEGKWGLVSDIVQLGKAEDGQSGERDAGKMLRNFHLIW